ARRGSALLRRASLSALALPPCPGRRVAPRRLPPPTSSGATPPGAHVGNRRMATGGRGEVRSERPDSRAGRGKRDPIRADLGLAAQQWAGLDDAPAHFEDAPLCLL